MFNIFDRDFTTPANETERELKIPALTGQDGKLMRGLTQENVEMNRQVKIEKNRAMQKEHELEELIYNLHNYTLHQVEKDKAVFAIAYLKEDAQESVQVQTQRFEINGRLGKITAGDEQTQTVKLHKTLFIPDITAMSYSDDTFIWTVNEESDKLIVSASGHTLAAGEDKVEFTLIQGTSSEFTLSDLYTVKYYG